MTSPMRSSTCPFLDIISYQDIPTAALKRAFDNAFQRVSGVTD